MKGSAGKVNRHKTCWVELREEPPQGVLYVKGPAREAMRLDLEEEAAWPVCSQRPFRDTYF